MVAYARQYHSESDLSNGTYASRPQRAARHHLPWAGEGTGPLHLAGPWTYAAKGTHRAFKVVGMIVLEVAGVRVQTLVRLQYADAHQDAHHGKRNRRDPQQDPFGDQLAEALPANDTDARHQDQCQ